MTPHEFRENRLTLKLTQRQLAHIWDMGKNGERTIRRWEQGEIPVNPIAAFCIKQMDQIRLKTFVQ